MDKIIAHRGASAVAPENTLAAFRKAAELGCKWLEFDVRMLGDGTVVVIHDARFDRTSDTSLAMKDAKSSDLDRIDAGGWFSATFAGERVPTFAQTLALMLDLGLSGNVELKTECRCPQCCKAVVLRNVTVLGYHVG